MKSLFYDQNGAIQEVYIEPDKTLTISHPSSDLSVSLEIKFCPVCGEKLQENKTEVVNMKLSEVIAELEEKPNKKFEGKKDERPTFIAYVANGCLSFKDKKGIAQFSVDLERDWQEVKRPVPWQEAIEAWIEGKTVSCKHSNGSLYSYSGDDSCFEDIDFEIGVGKDELKEGKWYID